MAKVKVHAANFPYSEISITSGAFFIKEGVFQFNGECVLANKIKTIDIASEDSVKKVGGALGWGVAGGVLLGPIGAIAGIFLGGNKKEVTFIVELEDGRKFMGTTDTKSYTKVVAKKMEYDSFKI
ncbi:hypothetical protein ABVE29_003289 [Providencia stuartii]|uniref:hypothetical protein n=1 Tax=Providencia sp. 21OH12SH02B-Prov TaxID=3015951 RepID=UPI0022B66088|nr:hypothetical protein [Providencia sp. 21OH12SH02B-Prov]WBA58441.1 hypothetical protein O7C57_07690 [Providencia sp. 21OH12SH02B-Prov]